MSSTNRNRWYFSCIFFKDSYENVLLIAMMKSRLFILNVPARPEERNNKATEDDTLRVETRSEINK